MSQKIAVTTTRPNSIIVFSPPPTDQTQAVHGPLGAGVTVTIEKGQFLDADTVTVQVWDADDYAAQQPA